MPADIEEVADIASERGSDELEMDDDITVIGASEDPGATRTLGCPDEIDVRLDWATDKDKK